MHYNFLSASTLQCLVIGDQMGELRLHEYETAKGYGISLAESAYPVFLQWDIYCPETGKVVR